MKKATDRELLDRELKNLNRKIGAIFKVKGNSSAYGFLFAVEHEIQKRINKNQGAT